MFLRNQISSSDPVGTKYDKCGPPWSGCEEVTPANVDRELDSMDGVQREALRRGALRWPDLKIDG